MKNRCENHAKVLLSTTGSVLLVLWSTFQSVFCSSICVFCSRYYVFCRDSVYGSSIYDGRRGSVFCSRSSDDDSNRDLVQFSRPCLFLLPDLPTLLRRIPPPQVARPAHLLHLPPHLLREPPSQRPLLRCSLQLHWCKVPILKGLQ